MTEEGKAQGRDTVQTEQEDNPRDWLPDWEANSTPWHSHDVNRFLVRYFSFLQSGRETMKILVPLCGKSVAMMWMYKQGNTLVGVEFVEKACIEFFAEQGLAYSKKDVPSVKGSLFQSEDERLKIYCCDLYNFTVDIEGQFDAIWDRGSFVALSSKVEYAEHIQTLMSPCCRHMVEVFEYDQRLRSGPPYSSTEEDMKTYFGTKCNIARIVKQYDQEFGKKFGIEEFYICLYLISPKALKQYMLEVGGVKAANNTNTDYWLTRWDLGQISYHKTEVHPSLKKHYDLLLDGRSSLKILVPLCGKSQDILWLYKQGHTVIGIEVGQKPCEDFFTENKISYTKERSDAVDGDLYKSDDGRVQIYCCDIFRFSSEIKGVFDGFWDRGSYCAILPQDREKYCRLMASLAAPGFTALVEAAEYDSRIFAGPPQSLSVEDMQSLYGNKTGSVKAVESEKLVKYGIEDFSLITYCIRGK
ncbi:uncharacterized protein LOC135494778 isoform X2 [Lineus longissimus]